MAPTADPAQLAAPAVTAAPSPIPSPSADAPGTAGAGSADAPGTAAATASPAAVAPARRPRTGLLISGTAVTILAVVLLGFVLDTLAFGALKHSRDQQVAYSKLRSDLGVVTAPLGHTDENGALYPLGTPMALLQIPEIGVREVVLEGTTGSVLRSGPGLRRDTPLPGQAGVSMIMGRRAAFGAPFLYLDELLPEQEFTVTTGQGVQRYRVIGVRHSGDPAPQEPAAGAGRLILMTADGPPLLPNDVIRVDADLISTVQPSTPKQVLATRSLPAAERPLAADPSVWLPLVLWGQGLVIATVAVTWAWTRWGRWQAWAVGVPLLGALGLAVADQAAGLLPNLL